MKTVLIVGNTVAKIGFAGSYKRAFELAGFRVETFNLEAKRHELAPLGPIGQRLMSHVDLRSMNLTANRALVVAAAALSPAIIAIICNEEVRPATMMQLKISVPGAAIVNLYPDAIFNMRSNVVQSLPLYDLFCTHTKAAVPLLRQAGCRAPFYLPLAADPQLHKPLPLSDADVKEYGCDVAYVGNWRPEHEALFERLRAFDLAIWGANTWQKRAKPDSFARARFRGRPLLTGDEYIKAHRAAKIGLNPIDPMNGPSHNQRTFELPAGRVFSLVSRTPEVTELFHEGENVACFESTEEMIEKIRYYLARPEERQRIAENAYKHVVEGGHTYRDRVRSMLDELGMREAAG